MTMRRWKRSGARSNERLWKKVPNGLKTGSVTCSLNISKRFTTGAGSTALWATNHLWTSKQKPSKKKKPVARVQKKGEREHPSHIGRGNDASIFANTIQAS